MIVENKLEWNTRNNLLEMILKEKREKLKLLELEIFTLDFTLNYWKKYPIE